MLSPADGFPELPSCRIGLLRSAHERTTLADALAEHIVSSLDNMSETARAAVTHLATHFPTSERRAYRMIGLARSHWQYVARRSGHRHACQCQCGDDDDPQNRSSCRHCSHHPQFAYSHI